MLGKIYTEKHVFFYFSNLAIFAMYNHLNPHFPIAAGFCQTTQKVFTIFDPLSS